MPHVIQTQALSANSRIHKGLSEIVAPYDGLIVDLWGVIHDGVRVYEGALACLAQLKANHKQVVFLSNAPRRAHIIRQNLEDLGISQDLYHDILSSGEDTYLHLRDRPTPWYTSLGNRCFHLGLEVKIKNLCPDLAFQYVPSMHEADFILNTGLDLEDDSFEPFDEDFKAAIQRGIPMICANPDEVVVHSNKIRFPAGYLAKRYEYLGGFVQYHGKPYGSIYEQVRKLFSQAVSNKLLAIGDSLLTDIKGANQANIDSILIARGVHAQELSLTEQGSPSSDKFEDLYRKYKIKPTYALPSFQWHGQ